MNLLIVLLPILLNALLQVIAVLIKSDSLPARQQKKLDEVLALVPKLTYHSKRLGCSMPKGLDPE